MTINIEITASPDCGKIAALHQSCFEQGWDACSMADLLAIPGTVALVAEGSKGFLLLRSVAGEAEILTLAVDPAARRRGVACALIAKTLEWARKQGVKSVFLEVRESNAAALGLYITAGFTQSGRRKGYYRSAHGILEDAVMMRYDKLD